MRGLSRAANPGPWRGEGVGGLCIPRSSPLGSRIAAASSSRRSSESFLLRGLPGPASGLRLPLLIPFLEGRSRSLFPSPATSRAGERKTGHRLSISPGSVGGLAEPRGQGPRLAGAGQLGTPRTAMEAENQEARPTPQHTHPHKDSRFRAHRSCPLTLKGQLGNVGEGTSRPQVFPAWALSQSLSGWQWVPLTCAGAGSAGVVVAPRLLPHPPMQLKSPHPVCLSPPAT